MINQDLKLMSAGELWLLHEQVTSVLAKKIAAEKVQLDRRLQQLGLGPSASAKKDEPCPTTVSAGVSEIQKSGPTG
jgi:hypothetical protein